MKRRVISSVLCLSLALTAVSCGKVEQEDSRRQETEYSTEENEGDADDEPNQPIDNGYWHDEDNELDMDLIDIDAFGSDIAELEDSEEFIERLFGVCNSLSHFEECNPYNTDQTYWEEIPEDLLVVNANEYIGDSVYEIYIGSYDTSNEHMEMYINCFEYNGRYYVLGFSTAVSGVGG